MKTISPSHPVKNWFLLDYHQRMKYSIDKFDFVEMIQTNGKYLQFYRTRHQRYVS